MLADDYLVNSADFLISIQHRIDGKMNRIGANVMNNFETRIAAAGNFVDGHESVLDKGER